MSTLDDPFEALTAEGMNVIAGPSSKTIDAIAQGRGSISTLRFHGFDLNDQPLVVGAPGVEHEILAAESTVTLRHSDIGATVVVAFEDGDVRQPIVIGVVQPRCRLREQQPPRADVMIEADNDRFVVTAEREISLICGHSSVTLTRAGKVIIKGKAIISRASGHNKIKGAAVEIN